MASPKPDPVETARRIAGSLSRPETRRGRGATANPDGRFEPAHREAFDDGWDQQEDDGFAPPITRTQVSLEAARTLITRNTSPDIGFDRSINPYRGCEHGCIYCFARPNHAYVGLSPGLDFETKLFAKPQAAALLEKELLHPGYIPRTVALGTATDPYQPIEREHRLTRGVLKVLARFRHPVGIVTKSGLVLRDRDILSKMAADGLVKVAISLTTLDPELARRMEPRAPHPQKRLAAIRGLAEAGVPVMAIVAPIIPSLNDHEIEGILEVAREAGASEANYVLLRLPRELEGLVGDWFSEHYPGRRNHVFSLLTQARGGKSYDAAWGTRMIGEGPYADLIRRRFALAKVRLGYPAERLRQRTDLFRRPERAGDQLALF
ncbi:PA0069 family radical SAM protein [Methylobacterium haplocladii]|uniref:Radical SAM protein n=1 Tax=Methylobacterium haplocladii TaxID=1176176 RepID=A0A512IKE0_9HYPH|nr:PA0069 family radical SAM protein [Methylobacterium haplocladii]GEO98161.1 radical SAM protein [Methylobacterium haplocladii]GJD83592.1 GTP 3',8-cyclase [Methylobacterium haplocladii]GLS58597.1 radical SAM protein [Methylobacterium haplocladii]